MFRKKYFQNSKAQTALELAIFGSVVVFVISLIVRGALTSSYAQNQRLKALRMAMLTSFEFSEGIKFPPGDWRDGTASRNTASVLIVEDRLTAQSGKYGAVDRSPQLALGQAIHTRNLFMPVDAGEYANLPITDFFVNGKHFPLTLANLASYSLPPAVFQQEPNHQCCSFVGCNGQPLTDPSVTDVVAATPYYKFDLNRDGNANNDGVTVANCDDMKWQWWAVAPSRINVEEGDFTGVDVDGDLQTERILAKYSNSVQVMDYQLGDLDFSIPDSDKIKNGGTREEPGFTNQNIQLFTFTKNPLPSGDGIGTYLLVEEGKLYETNGDTRRFVRNAQRKDSLDVVQRELQLSNNTQRFCTSTSIRVLPGTPLGNRAGWTASVPNPVEVCCPNNGCCFSLANIFQTCMVVQPVDPVIYVRSRIIDKHGRKYITPTENDPFLQFLR